MSNLICLLLLKIQRTKINWFIWLLSLCLYFTFCLCVFLFFFCMSLSLCVPVLMYICAFLCVYVDSCVSVCLHLYFSPPKLAILLLIGLQKEKFSFHSSEKTFHMQQLACSWTWGSFCTWQSVAEPRTWKGSQIDNHRFTRRREYLSVKAFKLGQSLKQFGTISLCCK